MDSKEKHVKENESVRKHEEQLHKDNLIGESLTAGARNRKRDNTRKTNKLWLWLGVLVLIFILLYWLFSIGIMEDLMNVFNG